MNPKKSLKELKLEAKDLKLPGRSKYKRNAELEKAIEEFRSHERPIPAPRKPKPIPKGPSPAPRIKKKTSPERPIPAPRVIMNLPVPKIEVPLLEPVKRPLVPPRVKKKLKESAESVVGWLDWLKKSGASFVNKASETWQT